MHTAVLCPQVLLSASRLLAGPAMRRYQAVYLLLALPVAACQDSLSPPDFVGSYHLLRVNASAIPVAIPSLDRSCTRDIQSGILVLSARAFTLDLGSVSRCLLPVEGDSQIVVALANPLMVQGGVTGSGETLELTIALSPSTNLASFQARPRPSGILLTILDERFGLPLGTTLDFGDRQSDGARSLPSPSPSN